MLKKLIYKFKIKNEIIALGFLIVVTVISTSYYNYSKKKLQGTFKDLIGNIYFKKSTTYLFEKLEPRFKKISHKVKEGETFNSILENYNINQREILYIKNKILKQVNINKLNTNQKINLTIDQTDNKVREFIFQISNKERLVLKRDLESKNFTEEKIISKLKKEVLYKENIILQSLYKSAKEQKIPANIIIEFARIYGFQVDFQRDIRRKDKFQIMYEVFVDEKKKIIDYGNILFANLILTGEDNSLYYFEDKKNDGHYDKNGKSIQKALMKTPINGARLSSSYGMRKHPISGYNKMHKGVDFAAPIGTPIFAAGNGVIEYVGRNGGYGKYIRIRHDSTYKTAYAHLNGYKKGISSGVRVKQGDVIGYVGSTGKSTGPHLHYEIIVNGKQINPATLKLPSGRKLNKQQLNEFQILVSKIDQEVNIYKNKIN